MMPRYQRPILQDSPKRQFIAGATCPKCGSQDTTVQVTTADDEWAECISCQHIERRPSAESIQLKNAREVNEPSIVKFKH